MKNKIEELDPDMLGILKCAFNGSVKVKTAAEVGKRAVEYFRGDDFFNFINNNKDMLKRKYPNLFLNKNLEDSKDIEDFGDIFIQKGYIYKAQYKPLKGLNEKDEKGVYKRPRWPKRLIMTSKQNFEKTGFYILVHERNKKLQYIMLTCLIVIVLICCMFPVWPLKLKLALWHVSVVLVTILLFIIIGRLFIFIFFWFFGVDYWIFPNLFDEDCNVVESFYPFHSWIYRNDTWIFLIARVFTAFLLSLGIHQLGKTHSISDISNFATQSFIDILEWGNKKLSASPENISMYKSIDVNKEFEDKIEEEEVVYEENEENYDCLKKCGFKALEDIVRTCFLKCECMEKIIKSECYEKKCSKLTKEVLNEAYKQACFGKNDI